MNRSSESLPRCLTYALLAASIVVHGAIVRDGAGIVGRGLNAGPIAKVDTAPDPMTLRVPLKGVLPLST